MGGRMIEKINHSTPLKPFLIAVRDVARTKKMYRIIDKPINTMRSSFIIQYYNF
jgi:hypothetical protein